MNSAGRKSLSVSKNARPALSLSPFFFCALGVNDVADVQRHEVGQIAKGGGELVIMESVDVADDVVGEAGYLLDISHEKQPCRGVGPVYDFLQVDGGGLQEVGI